MNGDAINTDLTKRVRDLVRLMDDMRELYGQLFTCIDSRLAAMKRADWEAMHAGGERSRSITVRLAERDGLRRQLLDAIGRELGLPPSAGRTLTVSDLAARISPDEASALQAAANRLRPVMAGVGQANRVAGFVARGILEHLRWVFEAVVPRTEHSGGYGGDGAAAAPSNAILFETLG